MTNEAPPKQPDIEGLRQKNQQAWKDFVHLFAPKLFRYFYAVVCNTQEAEDLVGETLTAVLTHIDQFREESSFETWLFKIGRHKLYDRHTHSRRIKHLLKTYLPFQSLFSREVQDPEDVLLLKDDIERLESILHTLPTKYREVLNLRFVQELSIKEVSHILNVTEHVVKNHTRDGRKLLQKRFSKRTKSSIKRQKDLHHG